MLVNRNVKWSYKDRHSRGFPLKNVNSILQVLYLKSYYDLSQNFTRNP